MKILLSGLLVSSLCFGQYGRPAGRAPAPVRQLQAGDRAPNVPLNMGGRQVQLSALSGKIILLDFFLSG